MAKAPPEKAKMKDRRKERRDMTSREQYAPGAASGADVQKDGDNWTLVLVRELRHPPARVWEALTDPDHLREWAPFDSTGASGPSARQSSRPSEHRRRTSPRPASRGLTRHGRSNSTGVDRTSAGNWSR
jgi:hypothetical protein